MFEAKKTTTPGKLPRSTKITKQSDFARRIGCNPGTLSRWLRDERWKLPRKAPWTEADVATAIRWQADHLATEAARITDDTADELVGLRKEKLKQDIRRLRAMADQAETNLARERSDLLPAHEVRDAMVAVLTMLRTKILNLPMYVSPLMEGLSAPDRDALLDEHCRQLLTDAAEWFGRAADAMHIPPPPEVKAT